MFLRNFHDFEVKINHFGSFIVPVLAKLLVSFYSVFKKETGRASTTSA